MFDKEIMELLTAIDEKHLIDAGYLSMSLMSEAKYHSAWKPSLFLKTNDDEDIIISGEKAILDKLKEIYKLEKLYFKK